MGDITKSNNQREKYLDTLSNELYMTKFDDLPLPEQAQLINLLHQYRNSDDPIKEILDNEF